MEGDEQVVCWVSDVPNELINREVLYNQEDDDHLPTLTVAQTIRFALTTKTPRRKLEGVTNAQFREEVLDLLLSMLNIKHTANTIVGNAYVRGVSGGERKRVSIAEQFCSAAALSSWDNVSAIGCSANISLPAVSMLPRHWITLRVCVCSRISPIKLPLSLCTRPERGSTSRWTRSWS
jgi:hypothetical protein